LPTSSAMSTDRRQPAPLIPNPRPGPRPLRFGHAPPVGRDDLLTAGDADADAAWNSARRSQWKPPGPAHGLSSDYSALVSGALYNEMGIS
jgi:hypothetical protein